MPQSKPLNWLLIFFMIFISMLTVFSYFPLFKNNLTNKKTIFIKENEMKW